MAGQGGDNQQGSPESAGFSPDLIRQLIQQELARWQVSQQNMMQPSQGMGAQTGAGSPMGGQNPQMGQGGPSTAGSQMFQQGTPGPVTTGGSQFQASPQGMQQGTQMNPLSQAGGSASVPGQANPVQIQGTQQAAQVITQARQELSQELSQNLQKLKTVVQETQGIAQKMEMILQSTETGQEKKQQSSSGQ